MVEAPQETESLVETPDGPRLRTRQLRAEIVAGPDAGRMIKRPGPSIRVGTLRDCDVVLHDPAVSGHHLTLHIEPRGVRVVDAGSRNGTYVDGLRVRDGDARPGATIAGAQNTVPPARSRPRRHRRPPPSRSPRAPADTRGRSRASSTSRSINASFAALDGCDAAGLSRFTATSRRNPAMPMWRARKTSPMPPAPSRSTISYGSSCAPSLSSNAATGEDISIARRAVAACAINSTAYKVE